MNDRIKKYVIYSKFYRTMSPQPNDCIVLTLMIAIVSYFNYVLMSSPSSHRITSFAETAIGVPVKEKNSIFLGANSDAVRDERWILQGGIVRTVYRNAFYFLAL